MNWYKKAIKMYETFGLADKLAQSFQRHYYDLLRQKNDSPSSIQKWYKYNQQAYLGSSNISKALEPIFEKHGNPQGIEDKIPKRVNFILIHPSQKNAKEKNAFFTILPSGEFIIAKVEPNINDVKFDYEFTRTMGHELQHFLRSLYEGKIAPQYSYKKDYEKAEYYSDPWEIQTFALRFASNAIELIESTLLVRIENMQPEQIQKILNNLRQSKSKYVQFAIQEARKKLNELEGITDEVRKKYYASSVANFNKLFDQMIEKYENELV